MLASTTLLQAWLHTIPLLCLWLCSLSATAQVYLSQNFDGIFLGSITPTIGLAPRGSADNVPIGQGWRQTKINQIGDGIPDGINTAEQDWEQNTNLGAGLWSIAPSGSAAGTVPLSAVSGTGVLWFNDYRYGGPSSAMGSRRMESPTIDLSSAGSPYVRFWLFFANTVFNNGGFASTNNRVNLRVVASNDNGATWHSIMTILPEASITGTMVSATAWQRITAVVPESYRTATTKIGIEVTGSFGSHNIWIDDFRVEEFVPTTITATPTGGFWSAASTWVGGIVPTADHNIVIPTGATVTCDVNIGRCQNITVNGTLNYVASSGANLGILNAFGDINVGTGGTLNTMATSTGKSVNVGGSFTNAGTINFIGTGTTNVSTLIWIGGQPSSFNNTGTIQNGYIAGIMHLNDAGVTYNSPVVVSNQFHLIRGNVNPNGNLTLGTNIAGVQDLKIVRTVHSKFTSAPIWGMMNAANTIEVAYATSVGQTGSQGVIIPEHEIPLVGGVRTVSGVFRVITHDHVQLNYPITVGSGFSSTNTTVPLVMTRGIVITSFTNLLTVDVKNNPNMTSGATPNTDIPSGTHGSYIAGPLRINFGTANAGVRRFPLGVGTAYNGSSYSSNALRTVVFTNTATWTGQTITVSIEPPPSGTLQAPLGAVMGTRSYRVQLNGGADLPATAAIQFLANNSTYGGADELSGLQEDLRIAQATTLTGSWKAASASTGTGAIPSNTSINRTTTGLVNLITSNGEYFAWSSVNTTCTGTPAASTTVASATTICAGNSVNLSLGTTPTSLNNTFQWQQSANNVTYTNIVGANGATLQTNPLFANTWFRCIITCTNGGAATTSTPLQINVTTSPAPIGVGASRCGTGTVTLTATAGTTGNTLRWFNANNDLVGTGTTFTTPSISTTTDYFVQDENANSLYRNIGILNNSEASGAYSNTTVRNRGIVFTTTGAGTIVGAYVYPSLAGKLTVQLYDNLGGVVGSPVNFWLTADMINQKVYVPLNISVPAAGNYRLINVDIVGDGAVGRLSSLGTGVSYPFTGAGGAISITGSANTVTGTALTTVYNSFFDLVYATATGCLVSGRTTVTATINPLPNITTQPLSQTVCEGAGVTFSTTVAGTGTTYQWQRSIDNGGSFTNLTGETNASLTVNAVTASMNNYQYRVIVTQNTCNTTSEVAYLLIGTGITVTTQPTNQTVCAGATATFNAAATGTSTLDYQWQVSTNSGVSFVNIVGATNPTLTLTNTTTTQNNNRYRLRIMQGACTVFSSVATLTVNPSPTITTQPSSQTVCAGSNVSLNVVATGTGLAYQWQLSTDNGTSFTNITTAMAATLNLAATAGMNNHQYRVIISQGTCSVTSNVAILTVSTSLTVTTQPTNQTACVGSNATFTVAANSATTVGYQWQVSTNGGTSFSNLTGENNATLTLTAVTLAQNNNQYRVVVNDATCSLTSNTVTLTVNSLPAITTQPINQTVCSGTNTSFTVAATGTNLTYQWQDNSSGTMADIVGANSATLNLAGVSNAMNGRQYRVVVSGACTPSVTSNTVTLTVNPTNNAPTLNVINNQSVLVNATAQTINLSGISTGDTGQTLTITATSSNTAIVPNPTLTYTAPATTGTLQYTPVAGQTGVVTITVTLTDNGGTTCGTNTLVRTFTITVETDTPPPPALRSQTITFDSIPDREFTTQPFAVRATASSGLPVTITVVSGNAVVNGSVVTLTGIGAVTLRATQNGGSGFLAATPVTRTFTVRKAQQSITNFAALADRAWNSGNFTIAANSSSGSPVVFTVTQGQNIATITNNSIVSLNKAIGVVTITATVPESTNFAAATPISRSFNVLKANQQITNVVVPTLTRPLVNETVSAVATSGLPITIAVTAGNATINGNTLTANNAAQPITLTLSQGGDDFWNPATSITNSIAVLKLNQQITLQASLSNMFVGDNQTINVVTNSNLPISFNVVAGQATINGTTITPTGAGIVTIEIVQNGNDLYNAATPIRLSFEVWARVTLSGISINSPICSGANFTVQYTTNGTLNSNNVFFVELSDERGVFNGNYIANQAGGTSGSIPVIIPQSLSLSGANYRVRIFANSTQQSSNSSNPFTINAVPTAPQISLSTDAKSLVSSSATGNQWFLNGTAIAGATSQQFTPTQTGSYTVLVTQNGCISAPSAAYFFAPTPTSNVDEDLQNSLTLFPNPTDSKLLVEGTVEKVGKIAFRLTDATGRVLQEQALQVQQLQFRQVIDLSELASGVYFLTIETQGKVAVKRVVKK
jgi:hypothetical protein